MIMIIYERMRGVMNIEMVFPQCTCTTTLQHAYLFPIRRASVDAMVKKKQTAGDRFMMEENRICVVVIVY